MKSTASILLLAGAAQAAPAIIADALPQPFAIPNLLNLVPRTLEINEKRKGWLYGTFPFGAAPYPTGVLANKTIQEQSAIWTPPVFELGAIIVNETALAVEAVIAVSSNNCYECRAQQTVHFLPFIHIYHIFLPFSYPDMKYT